MAIWCLTPRKSISTSCGWPIPARARSKLDTRTGKEVARYPSVVHDAARIRNYSSTAPSDATLFPAFGAAHSPSRTAVDYFGNVWVANRAPGIQPSATKIFNSERDCVDRNGNAQIDTSRDLDGNGVIQTGTAEFLGEADECVAFTVMVGAVGGFGARAAAIDKGIDPGDPGNAWIGMFEEQAFYQLNGKTGELMRRVPPAGSFAADPRVQRNVRPYGAAIDSKGYLWAPDGCCGKSGLLQIDTVTGDIVGWKDQPTLTCNGSYGIAVDLKDRIWLGGWPYSNAIRYDPVADVWREAPTGEAGWGTRGIGVDGIGNVWLAMHTTSLTGGKVVRIDTDTLAATGSWTIGGSRPVGAAVDFDGNVWTVNQVTSNASRVTIDPVTRNPTGVAEFPVGNAPYTYSDFTGFGLRTVTRPQGDYSVVYKGCADGTAARWSRIDYGAVTPLNTGIEVWVRAGDDPATIDQQPAFGPWVPPSPADLQAPPGPVPDSKYLQVIFRLKSLDRNSTPILQWYQLEWTCPMMID